jgi:hypothetical protein
MQGPSEFGMGSSGKLGCQNRLRTLINGVQNIHHGSAMEEQTSKMVATCTVPTGISHVGRSKVFMSGVIQFKS